MKVLANDFKKQWLEIRDEALVSFDAFGESGWYILGNAVENFETKLAKYWGDGLFASGCGSGLDAIELALRTLDIKKNDRVITTPLSAFATTLAIIRAGGIPVFVDVDESGHVDLNIVSQYLDAKPKTRFFIPVHLFGHAMNLNQLDLVKQRKVTIIEDCAQAIGAQYKSRSVGSCSDIFTTSFYPTKNLGAFGDGGAVLSKDKNLIQIFSKLRNYGQSQKYHHELIGSNSRLDELQASLMSRCVLPLLKRNIVRRRNIAKKYIQNIKNTNITILKFSNSSFSTFHLFPVLVSDQKKFINYLKSNNIEGNIHYPSIIPDQPAMKDIDSVTFGSLNKARNICRHIVSLPIHPYLSEDEIQYVIDVCNDWQV